MQGVYKMWNSDWFVITTKLKLGTVQPCTHLLETKAPGQTGMRVDESWTFQAQQNKGLMNTNRLRDSVWKTLRTAKQSRVSANSHAFSFDPSYSDVIS
jgi:hypothetical protein